MSMGILGERKWDTVKWKAPEHYKEKFEHENTISERGFYGMCDVTALLDFNNSIVRPAP